MTQNSYCFVSKSELARFHDALLDSGVRGFFTWQRIDADNIANRKLADHHRRSLEWMKELKPHVVKKALDPNYDFPSAVFDEASALR